MTRLTPEQLEAIHLQAIEEYPHECCGIIIGKPDHNEEDLLFQCTNIQNKLHAEDPKKYTRDARTAYNIDHQELFDIQREAWNKKLTIKVLYHSHPDHDAYFSREDTQRALLEEEPIHPDASYLVVSVYDRKIKDQALFAWNPETKSFEPQKV